MKKEIEFILEETFPDYDIHADEETKDDFWYDLTDQQKYDINNKHLKKVGNPKYDYLLCWEPGRFDTDVEVTDYNNMYEVDYEWWEFQKNARMESIEDYKKRVAANPEKYSTEKTDDYIKTYSREYNEGYKIYLAGDWYRLIDNGVFLYSQFISAKWFMFYEAESLLDELQEKNIPYTFRDEDFMVSLRQTDPTKIYDAGGRELELDSFKDKISEYQKNDLIPYIDYMISKYSRVFSGRTFRQDKGYSEEDFDPFTDFIFYDEESLKMVSPKAFLKTFNNRKLDFKEFQMMVEEFKLKVEEDFDRIYDENRRRYI